MIGGVLSLDSGARNMGWAVICGTKGQPVYVASGVKHLPQFEDEKYQDYKMRVIAAYTDWSKNIIYTWRPKIVVAEIVPPRGFARSVQNQLAQAAITSVFATVCCLYPEVKMKQISANTVKKKIGGSGSATKVQVRNGVLRVFPELRPRIKEWVKKFDEPDAIAVGLASEGIKAT